MLFVPQNDCFLVRNGGSGCNSWSVLFFSNAPATLLHSPTVFQAPGALPSKFHGVVPLTGVCQEKEGFRADLAVFRVRKRSPKHSKTSSPVQIRFFREGRRPEVCSERGVCHPRKVSGEFRGVVPRPLKPTQTTGFGAKTRLGLVQKWSSGGKTRACGWTNFFLCKVRAWTSIVPIYSSKLRGHGPRHQNLLVW